MGIFTDPCLRHVPHSRDTSFLFTAMRNVQMYGFFWLVCFRYLLSSNACWSHFTTRNVLVRLSRFLAIAHLHNKNVIQLTDKIEAKALLHILPFALIMFSRYPSKCWNKMLLGTCKARRKQQWEIHLIRIFWESEW